MTGAPAPTAAADLVAAERALFAAHAVPRDCRFLRLRDPDRRVAVRIAGQGDPLVLVHGSGMCAATWVPLLPFLAGRRVIAVAWSA